MQIHSRALHKACENLEIKYSIVGGNSDFTEIRLDGKVYHFNASSHPLNSAIITRIAKDKGLTYDLLHEKIKMSRTKTYLDPWTDKDFLKPYITHESYDEISSDIIQNLKFPIIIKKNQGSQGRNIFKVSNQEELLTGILAIFNKDSQYYDYAMLAQEYLEIKHEYRVVALDGEVLFMYVKDNENAEFSGNLSPLHWDGAKAQLINEELIVNNVQEFIAPIFENLDIHFAGLDVAIGEEGEMLLIEINTTIGLDYFVRDNGMEKVVEMYEEILKELLKTNN